MCGVTGIIDFNNKEINSKEINYFTKSLDHRGPDGSNYFINNDMNVGLGHTRLSILDVSERANQPFFYDNKNLVLTYNGEIYNFIEIRKELESFGYKFKTTSDTEVLLLAYHKWGINCQQKFNGMWAFAILDQKKKELFISRDRFGVKPLYYLSTKERFYFASELKSFMHIEKKYVPNFNYSNFKYCSEGIVNGSYYSTESTFLNGVKELPAGHQLILNFKNKIRISKWWSTIDNLVEIPKKYTDQKEKFFELFNNACNLRMRSDVKIATSLSGGVDSSSIVAAINQIKNSNLFIDNAQNPYKTFILDYQNEKNNETKYATSVAKFNNLDAEYVKLDLGKVDPEAIKKIIYYQEEVSGDDGLGPWSIYESIKKNNIKVSIDGHGGDELLAGYSGYPKIAMQDCSLFNLPRLFQLFKLHLEMNDRSLEGKHFFKVLISKLNLRFKKFLQKSNYDDKRYNFLEIEDAEEKFYLSENLNSLSNLNKSLYVDYHFRAMQMNLKKYDKFSMAHGVECRFPFLDWKLATFCFSLPNQSKIGNGFTKKILRDVIRDFLPKDVINRVAKKGFNPANELFNKTLKNFIFDTIQSQEFKGLGIWNNKKISKIISKSNNLDLKKIFRNVQIFYLIKLFNEKKFLKNEF